MREPLDAGDLIRYAREQAALTVHARCLGEHDGLPSSAFPGYKIFSRIKRGGQGVVYAALEVTTGRQVAIKVLRSGPFRGQTARLRFEREIKILAQLNHPHIVAIHASGIVDDNPYYIMDFVSGATLDEYLQAADPPIDTLLAMFLEVCDAVHAAHLHGIVHRDLKPANIRIDEHGRPRVLDFGLAKPLDGDSSGATILDATMTGQFVGSLPWAAPEQLGRQNASIDLRTDVYGLGLILYTMLAKTPPFERSASLGDVMNEILNRDPRPLRELNPRIDDDLAVIVATCLQKDPRRRYQIAGELARDVERYRAGLPIEAKRDSHGYVLFKTIKRHRVATLLVALLILLSIGYGVTVSMLYGHAAAAEHLAEQRAAEAREKYMTARDALEFIVNQVSHNLVDVPQSRVVRRTILEDAFERLSALAEQHQDDPLLRRDLMRTHHQLGQIAIDLGRDEAARRHLQEALELRLTLYAEEQPTPEQLSELSIHYVLLGDVAFRLNCRDACHAFFLDALAIDERLAVAYPDNLSLQDNLAWSYDRLGDQAARRGDYTQAEAYHEKQLEIMQRLADAEPNNPTRLHGLAQAYFRMSRCVGDRGDKQTALHYAEQSVEFGRRGRAGNRDAPLHMLHHITFLYDYAERLAAVDPTADTRLLAMEAYETAKQLVDREPDVPRNKLGLAHTLLWQASVAPGKDDPIEYERLTRAALDLIDDPAHPMPPSEMLYWGRIKAYKMLSTVLIQQERFEEVHQYLVKTPGLREEARATGFDTPRILLACAELRIRCQPIDAAETRRAAADARTALIAAQNTEPNNYKRLARVYETLGDEEAAREMNDAAEQLRLEQETTQMP